MRALIPLALASMLLLGVALVAPGTASASPEEQHHGHAVGVAHGGHWGGGWHGANWGGGFRGAWGRFGGPVFVAAPLVVAAPVLPLTVPVVVPVPVPVAVPQTTYTPLQAPCGC